MKGFYELNEPLTTSSPTTHATDVVDQNGKTTQKKPDPQFCENYTDDNTYTE